VIVNPGGKIDVLGEGTIMVFDARRATAISTDAHGNLAARALSRPSTVPANPSHSRRPTPMKRPFTFNTLVMIYAVVVLVAAATWVVPGGEYARVVKDGRTLVVPGSYTPAPSEPQGIGAIFTSPIKGFIQAAHIVVFVFIIGGRSRSCRRRAPWRFRSSASRTRS